MCLKKRRCYHERPIHHRRPARPSVLKISPLNHLRSLLRRLHAAVRGVFWFPDVPLALAMVLGGFFLLQLDFAGRWQQYA